MASTSEVSTAVSRAQKTNIVHNVETQPNRVESVLNGSVWYHRKGFAFCCLACLATTQYGKSNGFTFSRCELLNRLISLLIGMDYGLIGGLQAMPGFLEVFGYKDPSLPIGWGIDGTVQQLINSLMTAGKSLLPLP